MCGFSGVVNTSTNESVISLRRILTLMTDQLVHRGPDDSGIWVDPDWGVGLGHRRLSVLDLSSAGHQPMISKNDRYVITFNGEIYNHNELRKELDALSVKDSLRGLGQIEKWKGHSDTETLIDAISVWGVESTLKKCIGMFAFALWDKRDKILSLVRDRIGEKPLYYGWQNDVFLFGSELKALKAHPSWCGEIDRNALALYLRHSYVPSPYSIYQGISKLLPGTFLSLKISDGQFRPEVAPKPRSYWSPRDQAMSAKLRPFEGTEKRAIEILDSLLNNSIKVQMEADVPLGAFLSGGIDSSTIAAIMQSNSNKQIRTFTIGFNETGYDEAVYAKRVATHIGSDHTELCVFPQQVLEQISKIPFLYDEPFADASQLPTMLVCEMAKKHVTVSLSGDGGDELFGGYERHFQGIPMWMTFKKLPLQSRKMIAGLIKRITPQTWDKMYSSFSGLLPKSAKTNCFGYKLHKLAQVMDAETFAEYLLKLVSHWKNTNQLVIGGKEPSTTLNSPQFWPDMLQAEECMMYLDLINYLPDDILVKLDRASMGVSLETRVPFLDHRIVEFAWTLPLDLKIHKGQGKWILRKVLDKYVPKELIDRPKMGFNVPIGAWLRGPLKAWAEELLSESRLKQEGYLDPTPIRQKWHEHISGRKDWQYYLWDILMFQAWLEQSRS